MTTPTAGLLRQRWVWWLPVVAVVADLLVDPPPVVVGPDGARRLTTAPALPLGLGTMVPGGVATATTTRRRSRSRSRAAGRTERGRTGGVRDVGSVVAGEDVARSEDRDAQGAFARRQAAGGARAGPRP
ncbi:hypothetical protein ACWD0A_04370 [Streptomyces sp. NPDC002867]